MKISAKMIFPSLLAIMTMYWVGCQGPVKPISVNTGTPIPMADSPAHGQNYTCPMHPEVIGKEGDKCPKCGMSLEPMTPSTAPEVARVAMDFKTSPAALKPKEDVTLSFTPKRQDSPDDKVDLELEHTKKIHLIVVSDDLSWFNHIHPEEQKDGSYTVTEKFPAGGEYTVFADYKPSGGGHIVDKFTLKIEGDAPAAKSYDTERLTSDAGDDYTVELNPGGGKFVTNSALHLSAKVSQNGKEVDVTTLEDYLGAKAHMVVLSLSEKEYLHVHPDVENGQFDLHTTFDKPGFYRGWLQFQNNGKVHTSDFVFHVQEGTETPKDGMNEGEHKDHETGH